MIAAHTIKPFALGQVVATRGAVDAMAAARQHPLVFLLRHMSGDWGEVSEGDQALNDEAVEVGDRIHSAYRTSLGTRIWVITESDRSVTTFLLPDEY